MAITVVVRNKKQIITPIRFARAIRGAPEADAPDVDDRGFAMGTRPPTWGATTIRGAMVGMTVGDTVRVKVLTEDIEDVSAEVDIDSTVPLFVTSTDPGVVEVVSPPGVGPLAADGEFKIRAVLDTIRRPVAVQVHLGGIGGPVLGELEPHVFTLRSLRLRVHFVDIGGIRCDRDAASRKAGEAEAEVAGLVDVANKVWRAAGIAFTYDPSDPAQTQREVVQLSDPGKVTVFKESDPKRGREVSRVLLTRPDPNAINVYFVHRIAHIDDAGNKQERTAGLTVANDVDRGHRQRGEPVEGHGILIADPDMSADGVTLAHELGHFLSLHLHSDEVAGQREPIRVDMWSIRRLMFSRFPPATPPHRNDTGYGPGNRGAFLTVKDLGGDPNDGEIAAARRRALDAL